MQITATSSEPHQHPNSKQEEEHSPGQVGGKGMREGGCQPEEPRVNRVHQKRGPWNPRMGTFLEEDFVNAMAKLKLNGVNR